MKKHMLAATIAILSAASWQQSAFASPITVDAGWYGFCFAGPGSPATAGCQNAGIGIAGNDITFTAGGPVDLNVTDAFQQGDTFEVIVNGTIYNTDPVAPNSAGLTTDPNAAFADPTYSHISIALPGGGYTVDIFDNANPFGEGGGAYIEAVSASATGVPEPATIALLLAGIAGLFGFAQLRRRSV
jgi:hypothetical protein